jgi:hypothetical protein
MSNTISTKTVTYVLAVRTGSRAATATSEDSRFFGGSGRRCSPTRLRQHIYQRVSVDQIFRHQRADTIAHFPRLPSVCEFCPHNVEA